MDTAEPLDKQTGDEVSDMEKKLRRMNTTGDKASGEADDEAQHSDNTQAEAKKKKGTIAGKGNLSAAASKQTIRAQTKSVNVLEQRSVTEIELMKPYNTPPKQWHGKDGDKE